MPTTLHNQTWDRDGNLIHEETVEAPDDPQEVADREFRAAIENATSIADLKAALLGTNSKGRADVRPS